MNTISIHVRSARLAVIAAVRHAGFAPWFLVVGWGLFAALQEPVLFRSYGIRLPFQAAWPAGLALLAVLVANCPRPRLPYPQVYVAQALTALLVIVVAAVLAVVEGARSSADGLRLTAGWLVGSLVLAPPFALVLLAVRGLRAPTRILCTGIALLVVATLAVRFDADPWSLRTLAATLCLGLAAGALACNPPRPHAHRHPR